MVITTIRKIIKIGDSAGVTIPAADLKHAGVKPGDTVEVSIRAVTKPDEHTVEVVSLTQQLIARHKEALKNLSQR